MRRFKVGVVQLLVGENKEQNISAARAAINKAKQFGADLVVLPEIWNSPYANASFPANAEPQNGPSFEMLSAAARENKIVLIGGSIPEVDGGKIFNTSYSFNENGELIGKYRKAHLFDIDIPGKMTFKESETLTGGDNFTVLDTKFGKIGLGICYDIRFPEFSLVLSRFKDCKILCFPGAFNTTTGPKHWELLIRSRAVDNQSFVIAASPARNPASAYQAWGHSSVCSPWGEIVATTEEKEDIIYAEIDTQVADEMREMIPVRRQRRDDLYELVSRK